MKKFNFVTIVCLTMLFLVVVFFGSCNRQSQNSKSGKVNMVEEIKYADQTDSVKMMERCDIEIVLDVEKNIDNISDTLVYQFLHTFDESCKNNIEFSEYSNEVLFKLINKQPKKMVENISKEGINIDIILEELANPISDVVILDDVINSIQSVTTDKQLKDRLIKALKNGN